LGGLSSLKGIGRQGETTQKPIVVSTWDHGQAANEAAWKILAADGKAIDSAEAGVRVTEADPDVTTVGFGGFPDRDGNVTLDACIQDETGNCGSVAFLQQIKHPVSVARKVMEETPHVMLVGQGALQFALEQGFKQENLLTEKARKAWDSWLEKAEYKPVINIETTDTIGLLALDAQGRMGGACTTSGAAFKMHGRVGDSPLIGAGLFVDGEVGAACATGMGELVIKTVGSHLVVELMHQGHSPQSACEQAVKRIATKLPDYKDFQVGFLALNRKGQYGAFCIQPGFTYAVRSGELNRLEKSESLL
jgi:L-asparaginase/N4-(beta-N-acetylglucosaminyl)-L-asparaginase